MDINLYLNDDPVNAVNGRAVQFCVHKSLRKINPISSRGIFRSLPWLILPVCLKYQRKRDRQTAALPRVSFGLISEDRKSTRLNSSHVKISYAVFCLTKKTN